ncbi:DUF3408 domain-containing protein [Chryseobacterium turcicum]|uniref:DUF3408 domain-containing protein n=1 Tax=Chryseobacterium turcicum TaxID=2898076 RepID=A0A9Q3V355_9FLAO|nr:DUF3408 domain-containing protein [Chryseobacterium turcicum]MCD1117472.1 DUF3408 domain-containing protein [Chryseobacterium turcicum]
MAIDRKNEDFEKPQVDEEYLLNVISGEELSTINLPEKLKTSSETKPKEKSKVQSFKKADYEETFMTNRFPSGRNGKVVYIRPEYHERLIRIVQLTRDEKMTLYSYIDNILEQHFKDYGDDITQYFNDRFKPIL